MACWAFGAKCACVNVGAHRHVHIAFLFLNYRKQNKSTYRLFKVKYSKLIAQLLDDARPMNDFRKKIIAVITNDIKWFAIR